MSSEVEHGWVSARLAQWRSGLLSDQDAERLARHLEACASCRERAGGFEAGSSGERGAHLPAAMIAAWPRARGALRGLERTLVRHHLGRCPECRQDLELLGHEPVLQRVPELETEAALSPPPGPSPETVAAEPIATGRATTVVRVVKGAPWAGWRWRDRALVAWASLATAAAVLAVVVVVRRPVVEGVPAPLQVMLNPPVEERTGPRDGGLSVRLAPRPRNLSGPARGTSGGKVTVIPVVGPVPSLALAVRPLNVPDTSWVSVSLVSAEGDTLFTVHHRQWEFFPKRMLVIDGRDAPLLPGRYALVLASLISGREAPTVQMSRYLFELRPRR